MTRLERALCVLVGFFLGAAIHAAIDLIIVAQTLNPEALP